MEKAKIYDEQKAELEICEKFYSNSLQTLLANPKYFGSAAYAAADARDAANAAVTHHAEKVRQLNTEYSSKLSR